LDRVKCLLKMIIYRRRFKDHLRRIREQGLFSCSTGRNRAEPFRGCRDTLYNRREHTNDTSQYDARDRGKPLVYLWGPRNSITLQQRFKGVRLWEH
jgi:hypothetical protein